MYRLLESRGDVTQLKTLATVVRYDGFQFKIFETEKRG